MSKYGSKVASSTNKWKTNTGNSDSGNAIGVYQKLPPETLKFRGPNQVEDPEPVITRRPDDPKNIVQFVKAIAAASGAKAGTFKPYFFLSKKRKFKKKSHRFSSKVPFSTAEKRRLGLHLLPKKGLKFEDFVPLHAMWKEYMVELINIKELQALGLGFNRPGRFQALPQNGRGSETSLQLLKADYHGAFVTVTRSLCPAHIGLRGIVIMDTKNTVKIIGQDDTVRIIPKESSVFSLSLDGFQLTVFGKYLCVRPAERSVKKIKARMAADL